MLLSSWLFSLNRQFRSRISRSSHARRNRNRYHQPPSARVLVSRNAAETLEDRTFLTAFAVVNTNDSGAGSLRDAIEQANANAGADTISFDAALAGQTIVLTDEMWISDDLTITGLGADLLTIDGNGDSRIFTILGGSIDNFISVEISGLSFTNGFGDNGGAIRNYADLTVTDCVFSGNDVSDPQIVSAGINNGGAIRNDRGTLIVESTTFANNSANDGGAIYNIYGSVVLVNSALTENSASTTQGQGGGIYNLSGSLTISDSLFSMNSSVSGSGGGITNHSGELEILNCNFSKNSAYALGGGVENNSGSMIISNSTFSQNSVAITNGQGGGGVSNITYGMEEVSIISCTFALNTAGTIGGGIYNIGNMVIDDCNISDNSAGSAGGGIHHGDNLLEIKNSTIANNTASFSELGKGGGIFNSGEMVIIGSTIAGNRANLSGGGVSNIHGVVEIFNSTLSDNQVELNAQFTAKGGAISNEGFSDSGFVFVTNSTITGNSSVFSGGGVYSFFNTLTLTNTILAGNTAPVDPQFDGNITNHNSIIQDSIEGLLDPILRDNGGPTLTHALLADSAAINAGNNSAVVSAGIFTDQRGLGYPRIVGGTVDVGAFEYLGSHFLVDSATDTDDGDYSVGNLSLREAIKLSNESATADTITFDVSLFDQTLMLLNELVITDDVTIIGHGAEHLTLSGDGTRRLFRIDDGDAETSISVQLSEFTLTNGFANVTSGGAIHSLETLSISDVLFTDNEASVFSGPIHGGSYGGAIFSAGDLTVTNSTFVRNSADWYGGAIYSTEGLLSITGCDFTENQTSYAGGAILVQNGDLTVSASTFTENSSDSSGGGIYITQGVLTVSDTVFTENSSSVGGAIYHQISSSFPPVFTELSITDSTFRRNTATSSGGAVYYGSALSFYNAYHNAYIENSLFTENSANASSGGALYLSGNNVLVSGSTFVKNRALLNGGGISNSSRNLTVQNSLFEKNSASSFGGGLYITGELVLINSTLSGNTSLVAGGGIAAGNSFPTIEIINSTLTGNAAVQVGGGIYSFAGTVGTLTNSIVAGNSAPGLAQASVWFTRNNSIIQDSIEGLLDPVLRDNGGLTKTHALLSGSAAIDAGDDTALDDEDVNPFILNKRETTHDSRGLGFDRYRGEAIDIGAFEVQSPFAQIEMTLVDSKTTTAGNGERATLPNSLSWIDEWSGYWLEIWVSAPSATDVGVMSVALSLTYNTAITTAVAIEYGAAFNINQTGTIDDASGLIAGLSAETSLTDVGDDQRVLFARIRFESTADDGIDLDLEGQTLIAESPEFTIFGSEVQLTGGAESEEVHGPSPETLVFANPYDLNDDGEVNFRDLILFAGVYNTDPTEATSEYSWFADLDQSNSVNFRDLISFASNYGKSKSNQSTIHYPQNFTDNLSRHLSVDPTLLPQENPRPLEQPDAEAVLAGVTEYLAPQLTSEQNEKLAQVDIQVIDLANGVLSNTVRNTIYVDVNAAGYGWFIDQTPADSDEFSPAGPYRLIPFPIGPTRGQVDLWTAILHEIGHVLGHDHDESGLMQDSLAPGVRYLPDWFEETDAFFSSVSAETELLSF